MTVGLPGTGIGGIFYLASALAMPLREAYRQWRAWRDGGGGGDGGGAPSGGWRVVAAQTAIAGGIVVGIWATGWLLGMALAAARPAVAVGGGTPPGNVIRTAAVFLSAATLVMVLLGVELLRLWVHRPARRAPEVERREERVEARRERRLVAVGGERPARAGLVVRGLLLLAVLQAVAAAAPPAAIPQQVTGSPVAGHLARADSAFTAGDAGAAAREYSAVLAADPENSRATYRLAQLRRENPAEALQLFQRYVTLEPSDPWGYMAVADVLARSGQYAEALRWYDDALRIAPGERDAVEGRAQVLARARAAAPAITPLVSGSRDSDGNTRLRLGGTVELPASGPTRLGVTASRDAVGDGVTTTHLNRLGLRWTWQPKRGVKLDATGGAALLDAVDPGRPLASPPAPPGPRAGAAVPAALIPTAELRARWRGFGRGPALDLRAQRGVLDASPQLVANRVVRTELGAIVELPVAARFKLRGIGRAAALSASGERNHRTAIGGVVALAATRSVELSGQLHEIRYTDSSAAGYFAPRLAQVVEAGSYVEIETARSLVLAFDVGVGVRRAAEHGAPVGPWRRALRWYSLFVVPLTPGGGRDLRLELEGEDSPIANEAATAGPWRYGSAAVSVRWALR